MKRDFFRFWMVLCMAASATLGFIIISNADYNIGTGYLARVSPVLAEGNVVAVTSAGLLYDSGVSAYSIGTSAIKDSLRATGWTDTLGGASLHALEHAFAEYADIKITGPSSCVDNQIVRYDGITGKIGQASYAYVDDSGSLNIPTGQSYKINSTSIVQNSNRVTGWTATAGTASMAALEQAFVQYADDKVVGAASSVDNQIARFDGVTGKIAQVSFAYVDDTGNITIPALATVDGVDVSVRDAAVMTGAASSVDNQLVRFDLATGKVAQASFAYVDDTGNLEIPAAAKATVGKLITAQISYDMSAGVTATAIETAVGAGAAACGAGYQVSIVSLATACYKCETNGTGWWFEELEAAP